MGDCGGGWIFLGLGVEVLEILDILVVLEVLVVLVVLERAMEGGCGWEMENIVLIFAEKFGGDWGMLYFCGKNKH